MIYYIIKWNIGIEMKFLYVKYLNLINENQFSINCIRREHVR